MTSETLSQDFKFNTQLMTAQVFYRPAFKMSKRWPSQLQLHSRDHLTAVNGSLEIC